MFLLWDLWGLLLSSLSESFEPNPLSEELRSMAQSVFREYFNVAKAKGKSLKWTSIKLRLYDAANKSGT